MNRVLFSLILCCLFFIFIQMVIKRQTDKSNNSNYVVLRKYDGFEVRSYPELFVATTKLASSDYDGNSAEGFRRIANFIFGGNDRNQKIAMTSPVLMDMKDSVEMSFIMPEGIEELNAPKPDNTGVYLEKRPAKTVAVLTFGGWASTNKILEKKEELLQLLNKHQLKYSGIITYMGYNPPYQVVDRRNEVAVSIEW